MYLRNKRCWLETTKVSFNFLIEDAKLKMSSHTIIYSIAWPQQEMFRWWHHLKSLEEASLFFEAMTSPVYDKHCIVCTKPILLIFILKYQFGCRIAKKLVVDKDVHRISQDQISRDWNSWNIPGKKTQDFCCIKTPGFLNNIPEYPVGFYFWFLCVIQTEIYLQRA